MRSYTIIGAGAVGLLYGTRLAHAGHTVRWLVRSGADEIRRTGITVAGRSGSLTIDPDDVEVYDRPADVPASDVVIVALKTTANDRLAEIVAPAVADGATAVLFQNGLGVEAQLRDAVPHAAAVVGAMCFVCVHRLGPGVADHLDYGAVTLGPLEAAQVDVAHRVGDDLADAGIETGVVDDLATARWRKLVWNIPFNGLSVVLDATTDELLASRSTRSLVAALMDEVIGAGQAAGAAVPSSFRDEMLATTDAMTSYAPSMKLDHDAGRPLELAAIYDAPIAAAAAVDAPMAKVEALRNQLRFLDERRAAPRSHG